MTQPSEHPTGQGAQELPPLPVEADGVPEPPDPAQQPAAGGDAGGEPAQGAGSPDSY